MNAQVTIENYPVLRSRILELENQVSDTPERSAWEAGGIRLRVALLLQVKAAVRSKQLTAPPEILSFLAETKLTDEEISLLFGALAGIRSVNLSDLGLTDLSIIHYLPNLEVFYCSNNPVGSLHQLRSLPRLKTLYCINTGISDLSPLRELANLEQLYCGLNKLDSLDELTDLPNLKLVNCRGNRLTMRVVAEFKKHQPAVRVVWRRWLFFG